MNVFLLTFPNRHDLKPQVYVKRELAEYHGKMSDPVHVVEALPVCRADPLFSVLSAMNDFAGKDVANDA